MHRTTVGEKRKRKKSELKTLYFHTSQLVDKGFPFPDIESSCEIRKSKFISNSMQYSCDMHTYKGEKQNISPLKGFFVLYYEIPR